MDCRWQSKRDVNEPPKLANSAGATALPGVSLVHVTPRTDTHSVVDLPSGTAH